MKRKFDKGSNESNLHLAAEMGDSNEIEGILGNSMVNINATNNQGVTALYLAAQNGHINVLKILIKNGASWELGTQVGEDEINTPLEVAACKGHIESVRLLLLYPLPYLTLRQILHRSFNAALTCPESEKRNCFFSISDLIKIELDKKPKPTILTLENVNKLTWDAAFKELFLHNPSTKDKFPKDKEAAIRFCLASSYQLLQNPLWLLPNLQFLSHEMAYHWHHEQNAPFPKFDMNRIDFWDHDGLLWPIPNNSYIGFNKNNLISRVLLDKFKQYGMGEKQSKWTGFIPKANSKTLLSDNIFFTENRKTISGLFHGNVHNIQRVLLLLAMESYDLPLNYCTENGEEHDIEPKELFSALMSKTIFREDQQSSILWTYILDKRQDDSATFSDPFSMHSLLLTEKKFAGFLQDYLLYSFCDQFIQLRDLHNHVYKKSYTNLEFCKELEKIILNVFSGEPAFAIQKDSTSLEKVDTIDELKKPSKRWHIQSKFYFPLKESLKKYNGDFEEEEDINKTHCKY
ncbi:MAG: ankyrin repeat domain-containing protein [Tatlockia sp.]|nr:ankyrin repeat domain-containing protein [Tatlockia sp.]